MVVDNRSREDVSEFLYYNLRGAPVRVALNKEGKSEITGTVWKILSKPGDAVSEDDVLMILESMKMEIPVTAPEDGIVKEVRVAEGDLIAEGQVAVVIDT